MTEFHFISPASSGLLRWSEAEFVSEILAKGGLAVLPTETGYMLAAVGTSTDAISRAFRVKQRMPTNPMHVACCSIKMAQQYSNLSTPVTRLLNAFTPGPLTVVVEQTAALPAELVTLNGTVGIRIPDHPATLQVIASLDLPVTATSMNRSNEEGRPMDLENLESFDWEDLVEIPVVVDPNSIRYGAASTLVRATGADLELLRSGPVSLDEISAVLSEK